MNNEKMFLLLAQNSSLFIFLFVKLFVHIHIYIQIICLVFQYSFTQFIYVLYYILIVYKIAICIKNGKKIFIKIVYLATYQDKKNVLLAPKK